MPDICLLGTGGMLPLKNRFLTSLFVEYNGKAVLIDCGEGTQVAFAQHERKLSRIEMILITHGHADHVTGLAGLLLSLGNCSRTEPLDIYYPAGWERVIRNLLSVCDCLPFPVNLHTLENRPVSWTAEKIDPMLTVSAMPVDHRVPCMGYSLTLRKKPVFLPERAKALEIPVQFWKKLHQGEAITLPDGRTIHPEQVTGDSRKSIKITYTTDTRPIPEIANFAENSDLFICEGMYGDTDKKESMNQKGHSLMQDACRLASEAHAERLWLTHYSPAEMNPEIWLSELQKIFPNVVISKDGESISL
ncbi:MAG: ribonuclease Z [Oscillospiraceae bacterium]|nr:ribonuclease Z [Oscillospiraceae bacterium]